VVARQRKPKTTEVKAVSALGVVAPPPIHVDGPRFAGSLATLFQCVRDRRIDLRDVPLAPVCKAYFDYLTTTDGWDFDGAGAALEALSYLVERKAWALLPTFDDEPEFDEPADLPEPTTHLFEEAISSLRERKDLRDRLHFRSPDPDQDPYEPVQEGRPPTIADLAKAFERLLARAQPVEFESPVAPRRSLGEQMRIVLHTLSPDWKSLEELIVQPFTRTEAVWWFLALLELMRLHQAKAKVEGESVLFARGKA